METGYDVMLPRYQNESVPRLVLVEYSALLQVMPQLQGDATEQTPPDLPSYLFKERIVYLVRPYHP